MGRRKLILNSNAAYHITNRSNNKEWFYVPTESAWKIFCEILSLASGLYGTEIHAFVLMANHYHLILSAQQKNVHQFMRYFQTEVCRAIQRETGRINHIFGTRYKWSVLWNSKAMAYAYKYVARNPVKAGICECVEAYPFSSVTQSLLQKLSLPITERIDSLASQIRRDFQERLDWLNAPTPAEAEEMVGLALRRTEFHFSRSNGFRKNLELLAQTYGVLAESAYPAPFGPESRWAPTCHDDIRRR